MDGPTHDARASGLLVIRRLHRMVRDGWRPLLGHAVTGGCDQDVQLRRGAGVAVLGPDGTVTLRTHDGDTAPRVIAAADEPGFDRRFPPDAPNRRNIVRRLYEIGLLAPR